MLIGSHFTEETENELVSDGQRFAQPVHSVCRQHIAQQLVLLFAHDELRSTCAYTK